jgi:hypothetical protein
LENDKEGYTGRNFIINSLKLPTPIREVLKRTCWMDLAHEHTSEGSTYTGNFKEGSYEGKGILKYVPTGNTLKKLG